VLKHTPQLTGALRVWSARRATSFGQNPPGAGANPEKKNLAEAFSISGALRNAASKAQRTPKDLLNVCACKPTQLLQHSFLFVLLTAFCGRGGRVL
jgi:hypothetical protein